MRIIFIRHGEPDYDTDDLTKAGYRQAEIVAERLKDEGIDELWSSTMGRAVQTARFTAEAVGLPLNLTDFIREITWESTDGSSLFADGHPWKVADELARHGIELNTPDWTTYPDFCNNSVLGEVRRVEEGMDEWLSMHGYNRNGLYYDHAVKEEKHRTVAIFSHGGSSSAAIAHMLNLPFPYVCAMLHIEFTGITIIRMDRSKGPGTLPCLELANDGRHVKEGFYHRLADM